MTFYATFYSFKGGVGRTLALANVAYSLAASGKRVALLDLDLEAPGLRTFQEFRLAKNRRGFLDYAEAYSREGRCESIEGHIHRCELDTDEGELWLMPSGKRDAGYQDRLGELSWRRLHDQEGTLPFIAGLKHQLEEYVHPHYVLIDARTGLSDIGGLSTNLIADMVVLVFNLTKACIDGSVDACKSFLYEGSRPKKVQLIASPVPPSAGGKNDRVEVQLKYAAKHMARAIGPGRDILRIDYDPAMVLAQELAVVEPDRFPAAQVYLDLCKSIQNLNPKDARKTVEEAYELRSKGRLREAIDRLRDFAERNVEDAEAWLELGDLLLQSGRLEEAIDALRKSCALAPPFAPPHEAYFVWGNVLLEKWHSAGRGESHKQFLRQACEKYELSVKSDPDKDDAFYNWGFVLDELAQYSTGKHRSQLFSQACEKYGRAVDIKPDHYSALYNWGSALDDLAQESSDQLRLELIGQACEKYKRALEVNPDQAEALNNWGLALDNLARLSSGEAQLELFDRACEKYQEALEIKSDDYQTLDNWAGTLLRLWRVQRSEATDRDPHLSKCRDLCSQANQIEPHCADYNFACLCSVFGDHDQARRLLAGDILRTSESLERYLEEALGDEDFEHMWLAFPEFREMLETCHSTVSLSPLKAWFEKQKVD